MNEAERSTLTPEERALIKLVPKDGASIGNKMLLDQLGWSEDSYWRIRNQLIDDGRLEKGRGRGGSVRLTAPPSDSEVVDDMHAEQKPATSASQSPTRIREVELYEPMSNTIMNHWAKDMGFEDYVVQVVGMQGRRDTGGKWSRPDILLAARTTYPWVPGKYLDIITFEVKPSDYIDITVVYEAVAHRRAAHRSYVLLHIEDSVSARREEEIYEICEESKKHGIGVIIAADPADWQTWEERVEAVRQDPDPKRLNDFIAIQAGNEVQSKILRWFR